MLLEDNHEYVIITPAYNEAEYIERTIRGVLAQSVLPCKWIIVDDGSVGIENTTAYDSGVGVGIGEKNSLLNRMVQYNRIAVKQ